MLPALFVSHGSPMTVLIESAARRFMTQMAGGFARPKAVLAVSAHWETARPELGAVAQPETIHDFYGFPRQLYQLQYPAPGAPDWAARAAAILQQAGFEATLHPTRGLDHGAWTPMLLAFPAADIPVFQLSVQSERDPAHHFALGAALRPLRDEGVLILTTGSLTHNLRELNLRDEPEAAPAVNWASRFSDWMHEALAARRDADLLAYRSRAPEAVRNHPTDEHLLPLFVALGAASPGKPATALHRSMQFGALAMDAYRFD